MPRMQRATIEEAARSLGVSRKVIELQIKSGSLVACQDPSFRSYVWIQQSAKPAPKPATRRKPKQQPAETSISDEPTSEIELLRETVTMLKRELEVRDEQLDRLSVELDSRNRELQQLCSLLDRTHPPVSASKFGQFKTPASSASVAPSTVHQTPVSAKAGRWWPSINLGTRRQSLRKFIRSLSQYLRLVRFQFRPPLFH